jgi:hypothetical protein
VVVVAILAGSSLLQPGPTPSVPLGTSSEGAGAQTWFLTRDEFVRVVAAAEGDSAYVGKIVVADIQVGAGVSPACPHPAACDVTYAVEGAPGITVTRLVPPCTSPNVCPPEPVGPMAVRIHPRRSVEFIASVLVRPTTPAVPWQVGDLPPSLDGKAAVVEGWLSSYAVPLSCPAHADAGPYGCGNPTWLTADPFEATTTVMSSQGTGYTGHTPSSGIRLQNGVWSGSASTPDASPGSPVRGLFLVSDPPSRSSPPPCSDCALRPAWLVDRIDAITIPVSRPSAAVMPSSPVGSSAPHVLTSSELVSLVREASASGVSAGRTVIADVTFERGSGCGSLLNSPSICNPVLVDSEPPIRLMNAPAGPPCHPLAICALFPPTRPVGIGPFALTVRGDGTLEWVGWLAKAPGGELQWSLETLRTQLAGLNMFDDYREAAEIHVVSGWISGAAFSPFCALESPPSPMFGCGVASWLTADPAQPNALPTDGWSVTAPNTSIRLQNGAYARFAPFATPFAPNTAPEPKYGTFLVRPVVPAPSCWMCSGPVAEVVARLDP